MGKFEHDSQLFGHLNLDHLDAVQTALTRLGYAPGKIDGKNGPNTQGAVKVFQKQHGLTDDGIVGPATKGALQAELKRFADAGGPTGLG
jgi:peptidoglycan hydrolase-like protein with peptidoglycan-binding domain